MSEANSFPCFLCGCYGKQDFNLLYEVSDPNSALAQAIKELPVEWEGSIEVNDHKTLAPGQMPLIDFWRTPTKK